MLVELFVVVNIVFVIFDFYLMRCSIFLLSDSKSDLDTGNAKSVLPRLGCLSYRVRQKIL